MRKTIEGAVLVAALATLGAVPGSFDSPVDRPAMTRAAKVAAMEAPMTFESRPDVMMNGEALSPAGCRIVTIANPHYASSVPGAVKVNAKSECNTRVPELDLSVTLLMDGRPVAKTISKAVNKSFIMNQSTYIMCKGKEKEHTFQGTALGTSFEGEEGKPYLQAKTGPVVTLKCDY